MGRTDVPRLLVGFATVPGGSTTRIFHLGDAGTEVVARLFRFGLDRSRVRVCADIVPADLSRELHTEGVVREFCPVNQSVGGLMRNAV